MQNWKTRRKLNAIYKNTLVGGKNEVKNIFPIWRAVKYFCAINFVEKSLVFGLHIAFDLIKSEHIYAAIESDLHNLIKLSRIFCLSSLNETCSYGTFCKLFFYHEMRHSLRLHFL